MDAPLASLAARSIASLTSALSRAGSRYAQQWISRTRDFAKRKWLESSVTDSEVEILRRVNGRQWEYAYIQDCMKGRLDGDELLRAVTRLQALRLLSEPRLAQPPNPRALFTVGEDAKLLVRPRRDKSRKPPRQRWVKEAILHRKRLNENCEWIARHENNVEGLNEAEVARRRDEAIIDEGWLRKHGF